MPGVDVYTLTENLTGAAPTGTSEGVPLDQVTSYRIILAAPAGQTLSGAGSWAMYHWNADTGWAESPDITGSVTASSVRSAILTERQIGPAVGRMRVVLDGVTTSSGTTASVRYELGKY